MKLLKALASLISSWVDMLKTEVEMCLVLVRFPGLRIQRPSIWKVDTLDALEIEDGVWVGPFTEIVVYSRSPRSRVAGKLILRKGAVVSAGCNIRAAGGAISIGVNSGIGPGSVVVASSHAIGLNKLYLRCEWLEDKTGVTIGSNCWIAAGCILLPGVSIGNNSIIGAGSVVTKSVPENEIWAGVPARLLRKIT
jgi:acetyltransferase-like isoleucine patch superfamily enzyme